MSLINEALKKAQKMRQAAGAPHVPPVTPFEEPSPSPPARVPPPRPSTSDVRPAARVTRRPLPTSANRIVLSVGGVVLALVLVGGSAILFWLPQTPPTELVDRTRNPSPAVSAPLAASPVSPAPLPAPESTFIFAAASSTPPSISPAATSTNAEPPEIVVNFGPPSTPPSATSTPNTSRPVSDHVSSPIPSFTPISAVSSVPLALTPVPPPSQPRSPTLAERDPSLVAQIERWRVAGVRASATDPRVLMNDRVYRIGDVVDRDLGLRLVKVETRRLTFEDARGLSYPKNF